MLSIETCRTYSMSPELRREVLDLCNAAFGQPFETLFSLLPPDGLHLLGREDGKLVSHLVITDRWLRVEGGPNMRTAYIDAVATQAEFRRRGFAGALLKRVVELCSSRCDLLALSMDNPELYTRYGFVKWHGRLSTEKESGTGVETLPGQGRLMVRVVNMSILPDAARTMTANWRPGGGW
jgi:aminoglycoside 2'-N-acetyltransferase I